MSLESGHREVWINSSESALMRPKHLFRQIFREIIGSRELSFMLATRDLKAQYRQSILGIFWMFIPPIATAVLLAVGKSNAIINPGKTDLPYPFYVFFSMALWEVFISSLNGPMTAMTSNRGILTKVRFPHAAIVIADMTKLCFTTGIRLILIATAFVVFKVPVGWTTLLAPLALFMLMLLGTGFGLLLAPIGLLYRDIANSMQYIALGWLALTPVTYPPNNYPGIFATTVRLNPVTPVIVTIRELATAHHLTMLPQFCAVVGLAIVMLSIAVVLLRASMPLIIERWSA